MSGTFKRGDRVAFDFDRLCTGTVQSSTKSALRVRWDDSGLITPADPQELVHATAQKEGRSTLAKEHATAHETNHLEKDDFMSKLTEDISCPNCGHDLRPSAAREFSDKTVTAVLEFMLDNPVPMKNRREPTVLELAVWCDAHDIDPGDALAALFILHPEYKNGGANRA